ncbi:MAG: DUF5060 domain-containing protein [Kiritimatiellia bacterium]
MNRTTFLLFVFAWSALLCAPLFASDTSMMVSVPGDPDASADTARARLSFPGQSTFMVHAGDTPWIEASAIEFDLLWPDDGPTNAQVLLHMQDWDHFWYQNLLEIHPVPGRTNHFNADLSPGSGEWEPRGHHGTWHLRTLMDPREFGIRVFCPASYTGTCSVVNVNITRRRSDIPLEIRNVTPNAAVIPRWGKFEVSFFIPDIFPDPFDREQVSVTAEFHPPEGKPVTVDAFYSRDFYRIDQPTGETLLPQGPPFWRARFAPRREGRYEYVIRVHDRIHGDRRTRWGPGSFTVKESRNPGFVRVSEKDPRYFEFDNGDPFFPIGHNIRSPHDERMNRRFPWRQRIPEGNSVYSRYFKAMAEHGENITEVWTASWSIGLEWNKKWHGYHGIGQYNMMHARELDNLLEAARRNGIYVNLVVHNHGKFSTYSDEEWAHNPFNVENGGYLEIPDDYFSDPRALEHFRKLMRYMIARWGYSTQILAWELWSELDLAGSHKTRHKFQKTEQAVQWHRVIGSWLEEADPYGHIRGSHVCGDYTHQNPDLLTLPQIGYCPVDAYHFSSDPLHIVELLRKTADYNARFDKPVLVTEFGGSHMAGGLRHLKDALHAALWSSTCISLGGAPMFWWWQLVDEENLYAEFKPVTRFMKGEDRRNPEMRTVWPEDHRKEGGVSFDIDSAVRDVRAVCLLSPVGGLGWIYRAGAFGDADPKGTHAVTDTALTLYGTGDGEFEAEFWSTGPGGKLSSVRVSSREDTLELDVPAFVRDIAFKVRRRDRN